MAKLVKHQNRGERSKVIWEGQAYTAGHMGAQPNMDSRLYVRMLDGQYSLELDQNEALDVGRQLFDMAVRGRAVKAGDYSGPHASTRSGPGALYRLLDALVDVMLEHGDPKTPAEKELHAAYNAIHGRLK